MRGALTRTGTVGLAALLMQACASGGVMESAPSAQGSAGTPATQSYAIYGVDSYFQVEWQPDERRGKPMVSGYIRNQWGMGARNVRLRVEALDAAGSVTATYTGFITGDVPPGARIYFEVAVGEKAPSYRVSVLSFDPIQGHG